MGAWQPPIQPPIKHAPSLPYHYPHQHHQQQMPPQQFSGRMQYESMQFLPPPTHMQLPHPYYQQPRDPMQYPFMQPPHIQSRPPLQQQPTPTMMPPGWRHPRTPQQFDGFCCQKKADAVNSSRRGKHPHNDDCPYRVWRKNVGKEKRFY